VLTAAVIIKGARVVEEPEFLVIPAVRTPVIQAGVELVPRATVGTGVEMAAGAGQEAIASDPHIPEERLAEPNRSLSVPNEIV
jgi:hypothetical protein